MKKIFYKTFSYSIISLLSIYIVWSFYNLFILSYEHWLEPTLYGDSFRLPEQGGHGVPISSWIFDLHNEHRILFSKLNSLLEVNFLNLSIGQTALFQNLLLVLLSCGIWTIINQKLFKNQNLKTITTLSGSYSDVHDVIVQMSKKVKSCEVLEITSEHPIFSNWLIERQDFRKFWRETTRSGSTTNLDNIERILEVDGEDRTTVDLQILKRFIITM